MIINLDNFQNETFKQIIKDIVDYACDNKFNIPIINEGFIVYENGIEKKLSKKAINKINVKIEKAVESAKKEYNESKAEKIAVNSDYYNNLI